MKESILRIARVSMLLLAGAFVQVAFAKKVHLDTEKKTPDIAVKGPELGSKKILSKLDDNKKSQGFTRKGLSLHEKNQSNKVGSIDKKSLKANGSNGGKTEGERAQSTQKFVDVVGSPKDKKNKTSRLDKSKKLLENDLANTKQSPRVAAKSHKKTPEINKEMVLVAKKPNKQDKINKKLVSTAQNGSNDKKLGRDKLREHNPTELSQSTMPFYKAKTVKIPLDKSEKGHAKRHETDAVKMVNKTQDELVYTKKDKKPPSKTLKNAKQTDLANLKRVRPLPASQDSDKIRQVVRVEAKERDKLVVAQKTTSKGHGEHTPGLLNKAKGLIGLRYRYGGTSPVSGMDCSGFTQYVYKKSVGYMLPRTAAQQGKVGRFVPRSALKPGDLVFFNTIRSYSHVGIYLGNNRFIHAPRTGKSIGITRLDNRYWSARYQAARRIVRS